MRPPVPVVLVAGFLGAGKTTLLNHLLATGGRDGARIGVLVNDFGSVNIDALLVAGQADGAVSLSNGCLCCSVDQVGLDAALATLLAPSAGLDAIVIEASGIAEPRSLIRLVTAAADPRMAYGGLVYVVDAALFGRARGAHPEIDGHVALADLVVVNKADLLDASALDAVCAAVTELNPSAPQVAVRGARVDPRMLFDAAVRGPDVGPRQLTLDELLAETCPDGEPHGAPPDHLHDGFTSATLQVDEPMDPRRLARFLERPPRGCYRIKGITWFDVPGHRQCYVVHGVGGFVDVRCEAWAGRPRQTSLVAIGSGMDVDEVTAALAAAVADTATAADEHGILHITRYLPAAARASSGEGEDIRPDVTTG
ncbi:MAG: GTP-binding protein [Gordonia sp. (in: high G+C Gram-positive bacteria)]